MLLDMFPAVGFHAPIVLSSEFTGIEYSGCGFRPLDPSRHYDLKHGRAFLLGVGIAEEQSHGPVMQILPKTVKYAVPVSANGKSLSLCSENKQTNFF